MSVAIVVGTVSVEPATVDEVAGSVVVVVEVVVVVVVGGGSVVEVVDTTGGVVAGTAIVVAGTTVVGEASPEHPVTTSASTASNRPVPLCPASCFHILHKVALPSLNGASRADVSAGRPCPLGSLRMSSLLYSERASWRH